MEDKEIKNNIDSKFNLKDENEDNLIEIKTSKENGTQIEEETFSKKLKYKLKYFSILNELRDIDEKTYNYHHDLYCNLLLMPSEIEISNKLSLLSIISYCYQLRQKYELIYSISNKFEKYIVFINSVDPNFFLNVFCRAAFFFQKQKNYLYAYKYILKCNEIINKNNSKFSNYKKKTIKNYDLDMTKDYINYLKEKKEKFMNDNSFYKEEGQKIKELIDSIILGKNNIDIESVESPSPTSNNNYLYVINNDWLIKAKKFIEPYLVSSEDKVFHERTFDFNYVYNSYFDEKDKNNKDNIIEELPAYPGPINNFPLTSFKDHWEDYINLEENDFIKKGLKLKENYMLINFKDWNYLKSIFDATNEIKRKKNNLDLVKIKFILFDKRMKRRDENMAVLKQKYIQINKNSSIKQLKKKILNCINDYLKFVNEQNNDNQEEKKNQEIFFFILNKDKKDLLVEMVYSFGIGVKIYESLYIHKLELDENTNLEEFFKIFDKSKHILIIETFYVDSLPFFLDLNNQNDNKYICSLCNKEINNLNEKYECDYCFFSLFCSKKCSTSSNDHIKLHNEIKDIIETKFNLSDLLKCNFGSLLMDGTNLGRCGLSNLGNTCYMNSVLQCLSKTEDLTKYFLNKNYLKEINNGNISGTKGEFSNEYYNLIDYLFNRTQDPFNPNEFRKIFIKYNPMFNNSEQQDALKFISSLLDNLHEDLNRITIKAYKELNEQTEEETDEQASNRWWRYQKSREDSIITDLFQGQYKSTVKCSSCEKSNIKYESFLILELPISNIKTQYQIKFFSIDGNYIDLNFKIDEKIEMKDIILKSLIYINKNNYLNYLKETKFDNNLFNYNVTEVPTKVLYNNIQIIEFNKEHKMFKIYNTSYDNFNNKDGNLESFDKFKYLEFIKNHNNSELVLFEKDINSLKEHYINVYVYPIIEIEKESFIGNTKTDKIISYPVILSIKENNKLKDLELLILKKLKKILREGMQNDLNYIEICYPHFKDNWEDLKIKEGKCPLCEKAYEKNIKCCSLFNSVSREMEISSLMNQKNKGRPLILFVRSAFYSKEKRLYKKMNLFFDKKKKKKEIEFNTNVSLYDSLYLLNIGENSEENSMMKCCKCNNKLDSKKEIQIYRAPIYLIIQLKRFKCKENAVGAMLNNKIDINVEYSETLNLRDFIIGPDKDNYIYDLYGVIFHKKNNNGGHYTAYCKIFENNWFSYDDKKWERIENPINKDAYMLFYKRRKI